MEWIKVLDETPPNSSNSRYFSDVVMVLQGRRKYKAVYQTEKKQFYRAGDITGREDYGKLYPSFWMPLKED